MDVYDGIMAGLEDALAYERGEPNGCVVYTVSDEDVQRHRRQKISKAKPPKKAKHKHIYEPCVLEYNGCQVTKEHGITWDSPEVGIGSYCTICGKIGGDVDIDRWWRWEPIRPGSIAGRDVRTEEAERELNPKTRTLATFWVDDWPFQKYVDLGENQNEGSNEV